jgi:drug/metabolite transporter (DMT)-like permease
MRAETSGRRRGPRSAGEPDARDTVNDPVTPNPRRAELLLLAITVVWGSTFVVTKELIVLNSPFFYTALRFLLAAGLLYLPFRRRCSHLPSSTWRHGGILGALLFIGFVLQTVGIIYTTASKAAFFTGMLVPFTPIVHFIAQRIFRLERRALRLGNLLGVASAAVGLYLLTSPAGAAMNSGDFMNLLSAAFFACFIVYLDTVPATTDKVAMTYVQFLTCGAMALVAAPVCEDIAVSFSGGTIAGFLYLTVFATVITMWVQNRYQGETTPTRAAVIFAVEPVVAAVLAYLVRDEQIGFLGVIGGAVIFCGLLLSEFSDVIPGLRLSVADAHPGGPAR